MTDVRTSRIAGTWYPGDSAELTELVDRCVRDAPRAAIEAPITALVSPHAGLVYSGRIAAAGYRLLECESYDAVLLLGPCHRGGEGLAVLAGGAIETPLGMVRIDDELASALIAADPAVRANDAPHENEHSLEVQLPFLQRFLPGVPIAPVLMGYQTPATIDAAVRAIETALTRAAPARRVLLIASSDLSHFEPRDVAARLDGRVVECLEKFDADALARLLATHPNHACGGGPIVTILRVARALGATASTILAYGDSGEVNGDTNGVVGYVSAALIRKP